MKHEDMLAEINRMNEPAETESYDPINPGIDQRR